MASVFGAAAIPFLACIALLVAETLQILSFAAPYWATERLDTAPNSARSFGLWRYARCTGGTNVDCFQYDILWDVEAWRNAVRGLESLAIIFIAIPLVVLPVYIYVALGLKYRTVFVIMTLMAFAATLCNIAGVIVHGIQIGITNEWTVGWCLIVCIVGAGFDFIGFLILLIATINKPNFDPERYYPSTGFFVDPDSNKLYAVEGGEKDIVRTDPSIFGGHVNPAAETD